MSEKNVRPLAPVPPDGMDLLIFYKCPHCGKHVGVSAPTEPRMVTCEGCRMAFPIIPVDEHSVHYIRIMLAGGKAAADPDFM